MRSYSYFIMTTIDRQIMDDSVIDLMVLDVRFRDQFVDQYLAILGISSVE